MLVSDRLGVVAMETVDWNYQCYATLLSANVLVHYQQSVSVASMGVIGADSGSCWPQSRRDVEPSKRVGSEDALWHLTRRTSGSRLLPLANVYPQGTD